MIQPTLLSRSPVLSPALIQPKGDAAAFGLSLTALLDAAVQPAAAPGKPLPPTPPVAMVVPVLDLAPQPTIAPVSAATPAIGAPPQPLVPDAPAADLSRQEDQPAAALAAAQGIAAPRLALVAAGASEPILEEPILEEPIAPVHAPAPPLSPDVRPAPRAAIILRPADRAPTSRTAIEDDEDVSTDPNEPATAASIAPAPVPVAPAPVAVLTTAASEAEPIEAGPTRTARDADAPVKSALPSVPEAPRAEPGVVPDRSPPPLDMVLSEHGQRSGHTPQVAARDEPAVSPPAGRDSFTPGTPKQNDATVAPPADRPVAYEDSIAATPRAPQENARAVPMAAPSRPEASPPSDDEALEPAADAPATAVKGVAASEDAPAKALAPDNVPASAPALASAPAPGARLDPIAAPQAPAPTAVRGGRTIAAMPAALPVVSEQPSVVSVPRDTPVAAAPDRTDPAAIEGDAGKPAITSARQRERASRFMADPGTTAPALLPQAARASAIPSTIAAASPVVAPADKPLVSQPVNAPIVTAAVRELVPPAASPTPLQPATEPSTIVLDSPDILKEATPRPAPDRATPPPATPSAPRLPVIAAGTTAPAFRLFARAIHAARREEDRTLAPATIAVIDQARAPTVIDAPSTPLDLTSTRWPQAMVDRIETLRDAASAAADTASTSIRLVPDALGTIDVSVRSDGDTVHVVFAAEQAATRTLLAEAQPRLAEAAEARGIKLAQAHVGGGDVGTGAQGNGQRQPTSQNARPTAPPSAARDDQPETTTTRIA